MSAAEPIGPAAKGARLRLSVGARRGNGLGWSHWIAFAVLALLLISSILAPLIAPQNPLDINVAARLQGPSLRHLLGTDVDGRDVLSRLIYGGRSAFEGVGIALLVTTVLGVPWGLAAGYGGSFIDEALMRVADALLSFPGLILIIAITGALGTSLVDSMIAIGVVFAPSVARLLRSSVLPLRDAEFVALSRSLGRGAVRVSLSHVLPNAMAPVLVQLFSLASYALIIEAATAFLGLGVQPPNPAWGADLALAYQYFTAAPLLTVAPGLVVTIGALCISIVGDGVRTMLRLA